MSTSLARIDNLATWPEAYVRPVQFADYLGVGHRTVYYWMSKGALPHRKIGGVLLISTRVARTYAADLANA